MNGEEATVWGSGHTQTKDGADEREWRLLKLEPGVKKSYVLLPFVNPLLSI